MFVCACLWREGERLLFFSSKCSEMVTHFTTVWFKWLQSLLEILPPFLATVWLIPHTTVLTLLKLTQSVHKVFRRRGCLYLSKNSFLSSDVSIYLKGFMSSFHVCFYEKPWTDCVWVVWNVNVYFLTKWNILFWCHWVDANFVYTYLISPPWLFGVKMCFLCWGSYDI